MVQPLVETVFLSTLTYQIRFSYMLNFLFIPMILNYMTAGHFGEFQITKMIFQKNLLLRNWACTNELAKLKKKSF